MMFPEQFERLNSFLLVISEYLKVHFVALRFKYVVTTQEFTGICNVIDDVHNHVNFQ